MKLLLNIQRSGSGTLLQLFNLPSHQQIAEKLVPFGLQLDDGDERCVVFDCDDPMLRIAAALEAIAASNNAIADNGAVNMAAFLAAVGPMMDSAQQLLGHAPQRMPESVVTTTCPRCKQSYSNALDTCPYCAAESA